MSMKAGSGIALLTQWLVTACRRRPSGRVGSWQALESTATVTEAASIKRLVMRNTLDVDFDTAFATGPARPHGVAMK